MLNVTFIPYKCRVALAPLALIELADRDGILRHRSHIERFPADNVWELRAEWKFYYITNNSKWLRTGCTRDFVELFVTSLYRWEQLTIFGAILRKENILKTMSDEHFQEGNAAHEACALLQTSTPAKVTGSPAPKPASEAHVPKTPRGLSFANEPFAIRVK